MSSVLHPFIYMTIASCYSFIQYQSHFITFCLIFSPLILLLILFFTSLHFSFLCLSLHREWSGGDSTSAVPSYVRQLWPTDRWRNSTCSMSREYSLSVCFSFYRFQYYCQSTLFSTLHVFAYFCKFLQYLNFLFSLMNFQVLQPRSTNIRKEWNC